MQAMLDFHSLQAHAIILFLHDVVYIYIIAPDKTLFSTTKNLYTTTSL